MSDPTSPGPSGAARGKRATRQTLAVRRDTMTADERARGSAVIAEAARVWLADRLPAGSVLAVYAAKGSEADPRQIELEARARGVRIVYPRVVPGQRVLAFHEARLDELVASQFGLREPRPDAPAVALADITAFVIPGLAFDRDGARIGWGRGYYDATLDTAPAALRIGLAFDCQIIERIPREAHDVAVHVVITEVATYTVG